MRKALAFVTVLAACGDDGGGSNKPDAGGQMMDAYVMPDAPPAVDGVWHDTYHTAGGPMTVMSSCANAPAAISVDPTSAAVDTFPGACKPDGTFHIMAPGNLGNFYLRVGGILYETNKRAGIDLSTDRLGRSDVAAITGVNLDLSLSSLQAWTTADLLTAFSANIGYKQNLILSAEPTAGATSVVATSAWNGYKIDSSKSDTLQIYQLAKHTTGNNDYITLDRVYSAPATITLMNNTTQSIVGSFTSGTAGSLQLAIDVASFNQFAVAAVPSVGTRTIQGNAFAAVSTDVLESPSLMSFAQSSDGVISLDFGTVAYRDPFPASWTRYVKVQVGFSQAYSFNGYDGTLNATTLRVQPKSAVDGSTVSAVLGPPTQIKFDGVNAQTASIITAVPNLTWAAPTTGTATDYEIQVYEAKTSAGNTLSFTSVLRMITKSTNIRIPQGYLLGQRQYVFSVRSRNREGVDVFTTPLRNGTSYSMSEALSALVTTN